MKKFFNALKLVFGRRSLSVKGSVVNRQANCIVTLMRGDEYGF